MAVGGLTTGRGKVNRITINDMEAIERIKEYCCEVTHKQWKELVRVADEVGVMVGFKSENPNLVIVHMSNNRIWFVNSFTFLQSKDRKKIPFHDFLAKLKGAEEPWEPKAGLRPTITRAEAETQLGKRIID